ncbi:superoxide dismutase [Clostridia bacterium]|nr:superoxide dismutase [Clostridia bacterium]
MPLDTYPYELPALPYAYDALEPYIDTETMHYHHDKHFASYIAGLNQALEPCPRLQSLTLEELLKNPFSLPYKAYTAIMHNGGGVYNHSLYFSGLSPAAGGGHEPKGKLSRMIEASFGSFEDFRKAFTAQALAVFGSGWTVLALTPAQTLEIVSLKNQDTMLATGKRPLLYVDVWEHAYYLKYKNLRADYLKAIWNVLVFPEI